MRKAALCLALCLSSVAQGSIEITEFMYSGTDGEFIEFTNVGGSAIDMAGWSFDDDSRTPGSTDLSPFGLIAPGESVLLTEVDATAFKTAWGLTATKVIGFNANNLGRNDEINIYDASNTLVDRLAFGDQNIPGTVRTQNKGGWTPLSNLGPQTINNLWVLASLNDAQHSFASAAGDIGSPGAFVPEPGTLLLLAGGCIGLANKRRRAKAQS